MTSNLGLNVDRTITIGLIITLVGQIAASSWWASNVHTRLEMNAVSDLKRDRQIEVLEHKLAESDKTNVRLIEQMTVVQQNQERILRLLEER